MSGSGAAEESGIPKRHDQGCVQGSRAPPRSTLSLSAPTGVQLAPTSPKLVEGEFSEGALYLKACYIEI